MTQLVTTFGNYSGTVAAPRIKVNRSLTGVAAAMPVAVLAIAAIAANIVFAGPTTTTPSDGNPTIVMQTVGEVMQAGGR